MFKYLWFAEMYTDGFSAGASTEFTTLDQTRLAFILFFRS